MDDGDVLTYDEETSEAGHWFRTLRVLVLGLLGAVVVYLAVGAWRAPDLPDLAPDFRLESLEGQSIALADLRGSAVVLNFWATWCGPCIAEIPTFSSFATGNPHIRVLGISTENKPAALRRAVETHGITYPVLIADQPTLTAYRVETLPTTVVVGPDGRVETAHVGTMLGPQLAWVTRSF